MNGISFLMMPLVLMAAPAAAAGAFETDVLPTAAGDLKITFIGHASLMFEFGGKVIYSDPVGQYGDFSESAEGRSDPGGPRTWGPLRSGDDQENQQERDESGHDAALRRQACRAASS